MSILEPVQTFAPFIGGAVGLLLSFAVASVNEPVEWDGPASQKAFVTGMLITLGMYALAGLIANTEWYLTSVSFGAGSWTRVIGRTATRIIMGVLCVGMIIAGLGWSASEVGLNRGETIPHRTPVASNRSGVESSSQDTELDRASVHLLEATERLVDARAKLVDEATLRQYGSEVNEAYSEFLKSVANFKRLLADPATTDEARRQARAKYYDQTAAAEVRADTEADRIKRVLPNVGRTKVRSKS